MTRTFAALISEFTLADLLITTTSYFYFGFRIRDCGVENFDSLDIGVSTPKSGIRIPSYYPFFPGTDSF